MAEPPVERRSLLDDGWPGAGNVSGCEDRLRTRSILVHLLAHRHIALHQLHLRRMLTRLLSCRTALRPHLSSLAYVWQMGAVRLCAANEPPRCLPDGIQLENAVAALETNTPLSGDRDHGSQGSAVQRHHWQWDATAVEAVMRMTTSTPRQTWFGLVTLNPVQPSLDP